MEPMFRGDAMSPRLGPAESSVRDYAITAPAFPGGRCLSIS